MSRLLPRLTLVLCVLLGLVVGTVPAPAQAAKDPALDQPVLPSACVRPGESVPYRAGPCVLHRAGKNRPTVVLWGDSHAWQHIPAVRPLARKGRVNLVMYVLGGCPPIKMRLRPGLPACETSNAMALSFVRRLRSTDRPVRVLLGAFWSGYREAYRGIYVDKTLDPGLYSSYQRKSMRLFHRRTPPLFQALARTGARVDVIGQAATVPLDPPACGGPQDDVEPYPCALPRAAALPREAGLRRWLERRMAPLPRGSRLVEFNRPYCGKRRCFGIRDGIHTFFDDIHLSASRTRTLGRFFAPTFRRFG